MTEQEKRESVFVRFGRSAKEFLYGMAGHDMEALAQGIRESTDERVVQAYVSQARYLGELLEEAGVPIVLPIGAHAIFVDAKRFLPHLEQIELQAQTLACWQLLAEHSGNVALRLAFNSLSRSFVPLWNTMTFSIEAA